MKRRSFFFLLLALFPLLCSTAFAEKSPAAQALGSEQAARHLATHIYARTDGWDGTLPFVCPDETCKDYGHVRITGRRVSLWDSPHKGDNVFPYPGGRVAYVGTDTQFELTDVVEYQNTYYANIRVTGESGAAAFSGFINADYIACDCESYDVFEDVSAYDHVFGAFSLK